MGFWGFDLVVGDNELVVTVTAADGETSVVYTVILVAHANNDASLATFTVNGSDVADGDSVDLVYGTTDVEVVAEATDPDATVEVVGGSDLVVGENALFVTVTAADGETVALYTVTLVVLLNSDASLSVFTVNGNDVADGDSVELPTGTTEVSVVAEATDLEATVEIAGGADLAPGSNDLVVTVTAADGATTATYTVTLVVLLSSETGINFISVEGVEIQPGEIVSVAKDVTSVSVEVSTKDEGAEVAIDGADALELGDNTITVTVTAPNGDSASYEFIVRVGGASADTALTSLTLNNIEVEDGQTINLPARTTSVSVVAITRDEAATVRVLGRTGLQVGNNDVLVEITAPDLVAKRTITLHVVVAPLSSNTNLATFTVNGNEVADGSVVALPALTGQVTVEAIAQDSEAVVTIAGRTNLVGGSNTLTVTVTAANGTQKQYIVTLNVRILSADNSLSSFQVAGYIVTDGSTVSVANGTQSVEVIATATDSSATVGISGGTALKTGANAVTVLVTAENGATKVYRVTVSVALSSVTTLQSFKVNGIEVTAGSTITLPQYTKAVIAKVVTTDAQANYAITGANGLSDGNNTLNVEVTAVDGTKANYQVTLYVTPLSSDTSIQSITVNGTPVADNGVVVVPALTTSVSVVAVTNDSRSAAVVTGKSGLQDGNNTVTVTVTAQNGSTAVYTFTVRVLVRSGDTSLSSLLVNGVVPNGSPINVAFGTTSVEVVAVPTSNAATTVVTGNTSLRTGSNLITVRVIAENQTFKLYTVTVQVAKSSNTALKTLLVGGVDVLAGGSVVLPARSAVVAVKAVTQDPDAAVVVSGTSVSSGDNTVSVVVTAADGTSRVVLVPVYVTPLSSNTNLSVFTVNGSAVVDGSTVNVAYATGSVVVVATAADAEALVSVAGGSALRTGSNQVVVSVTAANGTRKLYTVTVQVAKSSNTNLASVSINGNVTAVGSTVDLIARTTQVTVKAIASDAEATISVAGASSLTAGVNTLAITVTAPSGAQAVYNYYLNVAALSTNANLGSLVVGTTDVLSSLVNGELVAPIVLPVGSSTIPVVAKSAASDATVAFASGSANPANLQPGSNRIVIGVTAADGVTKKTFAVTVFVTQRSSNANISSEAGTWTINGIDVSNSATALEVPAGTTAVTAKAKTQDSKATLAITGTSGLVTGTNKVVFKVTAEDGITTSTYERTVTVAALSSNTNLTSLLVAGTSVLSGATVNLPVGTTRVEVIPTLESKESKFTIAGNTGFLNGSTNTVTVTVTAPSGASQVYTVTVVVAALASNTTLSSFIIEGTNVVDGQTITLGGAKTSLKIAAKASDLTAAVTIAGKTGLVIGSNLVTVTVTAKSGASSVYRVTVIVTN